MQVRRFAMDSWKAAVVFAVVLMAIPSLVAAAAMLTLASGVALALFPIVMLFDGVQLICSTWKRSSRQLVCGRAGEIIIYIWPLCLFLVFSGTRFGHQLPIGGV